MLPVRALTDETGSVFGVGESGKGPPVSAVESGQDGEPEGTLFGRQ